jgi:hypothetical protein
LTVYRKQQLILSLPTSMPARKNTDYKNQLTLKMAHLDLTQIFEAKKSAKTKSRSL